MGKKILFLLYMITCMGYMAYTQNRPLYKDPSQPVEKRVQDLLSRMTAEEKFWQLFMIPGEMDVIDSAAFRHGIFGIQTGATGRGDAGGQMLDYSQTDNAVALAKKINALQKFFTEHTRLGIPIIPFDEALHGLVRDEATVFPQSIALAATWDTALMNQVAAVIATETKARGIRQVLSPVINIASDPRWGRTEETYGEDPFLTSMMGVAFVKSFEQKGIITTPKHLIANAGDGGRDSYPIHYNERLLDEIYFPPFKAVIEQGGARSIMTAYNSLDGVACSSNAWLLQEKLKKQWGFTGFVISDANAVGGEVVLHQTAGDYPTSGMHALQNGLDVIFQTEYKHHSLFIPPFLDGRIDSQRINDAVSRVLKAKFELGLFENPYVTVPDRLADYKAHKNIARQAARESVVLLKNMHRVLPLSKDVRSVAVIGDDANISRFGDYSGPGNFPVSMLAGIQQAVSTGTHVLYAPGCGRFTDEFLIVPQSNLSHDNKRGLQAEYFSNTTLTGNPVVRRTDPAINFHWTLFAPDTALAADFYSVRWTGDLISPDSGHFQIGLEGNDGFRLYIDDMLIIDQWKKQSYHRAVSDFDFEKGRKYSVRVEFYEPAGNASIKLIWNVGLIPDLWKKKIAEAVETAKRSDIAIIVAGITEGEFRDRAMLSLPGHQEDMINAVAATGKPVLVILVGGSAITMNNWIDNVSAVLDVWYPGEEGGHAIADVLFGDYNPAGRLPITFPLHEAQLPLVYNHKPTGRGDDYYNLTGLPLFPFGFGLSYTQFSYTDLKLQRNNIRANDSTTVSFTLSNTGEKDGDEVVQLYIRDMLSSVARPVMELKGFQRIHLKAGESKNVSFTITPEMLSMLDVNLAKIVEPGDFRIMIGSSSRDLRLKEILTVK